MPRAHTVELNDRACRGDAAAALALLEHSMTRGHGRIGLLRYWQARQLGAALEGRHHDYAQRVAGKMSDRALAGLAAQAQQRHRGESANRELEHDRAAVVDEHAPLEKCLHGAREHHAFDIASHGQ